jgi:uncharacterized protein (DUF342 family)
VKSQQTEKARQFAQHQETKERLFMNLTQLFVGSNDLQTPMTKNNYLEDDDNDNERSSDESIEY